MFAKAAETGGGKVYFQKIIKPNRGFRPFTEQENISLKTLYMLRQNDCFGTEAYADKSLKALSDDLCAAEDFFKEADDTGNRFPRSVATAYFHRSLCADKAVCLWEKYKRIYFVDKDWYKDFIKTEDIDIDFSLLTKLPFDSFYIDLSDIELMHTRHYAAITGVFVNVIDTETIHITVVDTDNMQYNPIQFYKEERPYYTKIDGWNEICPAWQMGRKLPDGTKWGDYVEKHGKMSRMHNAVPASWQKYDTGSIHFVDFLLEKEKSAKRISENEKAARCFGWALVSADSVVQMNDLYSPVIDEIMRFTVQFLYFLHSKTDDICKREGGVHPFKRIYDGNGGINTWDVGYRYGHKIRTIERRCVLYGESVIDGGKNRNRPRAYVRKAHWHRHWCGKETERRLEPRWHEPVYCNGTVSDIVADINTVTDAVDSSQGEAAVRQYLDRMNIEHEQEYTVSIKGHNRRYDFLLKQKGRQMFIEFDGEQHFKPIEMFGGMEEFKKRQRADWDKNRYAKKNKIPILRIRYDQISQISELIDMFLENPKIGVLNPLLTNSGYYNNLQ